MYCPIDGVEYRPGFTHCPDHNVELVPDPPVDTDEEVSALATRINARFLMKIVFVITVVAAFIYVISAVASTLVTILTRSEQLTGEVTLLPLHLYDVVVASGRVALAGLGVMGGTVLLQIHGRPRVGPAEGADDLANEPSAGTGGFLIRLLLALFVVFATVWTATEIMVSRDRAEYNTAPFSGEREEPPESFITLLAVNAVAYSFALTALGTMAAMVLVDIHRRGSS